VFAGGDRGNLRAVFFRAWQKQHTGAPLEGIEQLVVKIVTRHPEYHGVLESPEAGAARDYPPELGETNPFLHMAMHIAIEEGLQLDEPRGVRALYRNLRLAYPDEHALQHRMMDCLAEMLRQASRAGQPPDPGCYLDCLRRLAAQ
jgi:hypothetical protein